LPGIWDSGRTPFEGDSPLRAARLDPPVFPLHLFRFRTPVQGITRKSAHQNEKLHVDAQREFATSVCGPNDYSVVSESVAGDDVCDVDGVTETVELAVSIPTTGDVGSDGLQLMSISVRLLPAAACPRRVVLRCKLYLSSRFDQGDWRGHTDACQHGIGHRKCCQCDNHLPGVQQGVDRRNNKACVKTNGCHAGGSRLVTTLVDRIPHELAKSLELSLGTLYSRGIRVTTEWRFACRDWATLRRKCSVRTF
jgi:hypothetical protein